MTECRVCCIECHEFDIYTCSMCNYNSCKECCKKYFITLSGEPECINCKVLINKDEFVDIFTIKWVFGKYMKYKNELLYDKQKSLLVTTKDDAEKQNKINLINERRSILLKERKLINEQLKKINKELNNIKTNKNGVKESVNVLCSYGCNEVCVLVDESYKCIVCSKYTCGRCNSGIEENIGLHKCNIKPCPQCGIILNKDGGCDLINCTNCNLNFKWNSEEIINNNGVLLPELPNIVNFNKLDLASINKEDCIIIRGMYEHINEFIRFIKINFLNLLSKDKDNSRFFKKLRINYLINKINEAKFYKQIIKFSKFENYKQFIINIIINAYTDAINIFNNIKIDNNSINKLNNIISNTNNKIISITQYLKYNNNIKIHHWFNLNNINFILF
jgi:hypothetical protein